MAVAMSTRNETRTTLPRNRWCLEWSITSPNAYSVSEEERILIVGCHSRCYITSGSYACTGMASRIFVTLGCLLPWLSFFAAKGRNMCQTLPVCHSALNRQRQQKQTINTNEEPEQSVSPRILVLLLISRNSPCNPFPTTVRWLTSSS